MARLTDRHIEHATDAPYGVHLWRHDWGGFYRCLKCQEVTFKFADLKGEGCDR